MMWTLCVVVLAIASSAVEGAKLGDQQVAATRAISQCPEDYGLQTYPHPDSCHSYYKCANGTLTEELCEHGLLFDGKGNVYDNCNYHWAVDCDGRFSDVVPHASGPCEYDFGIFSAGACETYYTTCEYGQPADYPCTEGLAYDETTHSCNWPDLMEHCNPEQVVGFSCPANLDPKSLSAKFIPFPRFPSGDCHAYIICVNDYPRRIGCGDYQVFDDETLSCQDPEYVPKCK